MHSMKNTIVAIMLLGVSYGVYEVITTPDPSLDTDPALVAPLVISEGAEDVESPAPLPHVQLPEPDDAPELANRSDSSPKHFVAPPIQAPKLPNPNFRDDSMVERQPKMDFAAEDQSTNQLAGGEFDTNNTDVPHDNELIEALKDHLGDPDEEFGSSMKSDEFDTTPRSNMASTFAPRGDRVQPESTQPRPEVNDFNAGSELDSMPKTELQPPATTELAESTEREPVDLGQLDVSAVWSHVERMVEKGRMRKALQTLTRYYNDDSLTSTQQQKLHGWLDALASKVIYSTENHFAKAHVVQPNETILDLAKRWHVTPQLIYRVNEKVIRNPSNMTPGIELKVLRGPFHAEVNVTNKVLTVFVGDLYAGRFAVDVDSTSKMAAGRYGVTAKSTNVQSMLNGSQPNSDNQHGPYWIGLEKGYCLHASVHRTGDAHKNCIGLSLKDAEDLFSIFSEESLIFIKR